MPTLLSKDTEGREFVIQQNMGGTLSVVSDNCKYIEPGDGPALNPYTTPNIELGNYPGPQLYHLEVDMGEVNNIAADYSDKVQALSVILQKVKNRE